ncbi:hypothetical protein FH972_021859 [Carpinus fangiana]|uniref:Actin-related protein 8 n=1 Tax=Carpinus fangiana TaxID=176857 RepID=A0A5N6KR46_9ROSI|nr:hypothetical protein FH972_021859 [Carpinus fangiana]
MPRDSRRSTGFGRRGLLIPKLTIFPGGAAETQQARQILVACGFTLDQQHPGYAGPRLKHAQLQGTRVQPWVLLYRHHSTLLRCSDLVTNDAAEGGKGTYHEPVHALADAAPVDSRACHDAPIPISNAESRSSSSFSMAASSSDAVCSRSISVESITKMTAAVLAARGAAYPDVEVEVLVCDGFHVEPDGGDCCDHFADLDASRSAAEACRVRSLRTSPNIKIRISFLAHSRRPRMPERLEMEPPMTGDIRMRERGAAGRAGERAGGTSKKHYQTETPMQGLGASVAPAAWTRAVQRVKHRCGSQANLLQKVAHAPPDDLRHLTCHRNKISPGLVVISAGRGLLYILRARTELSLCCDTRSQPKCQARRAPVPAAKNEENRNRMAKAARDRDRRLAQKQEDGEDVDMDADETMAGEGEETSAETDDDQNGSKTIVIHPGSQNLRIGLASDILPKTVPMVIARRADQSEAESAAEPRPKRRRISESSTRDPNRAFSDEFSTLYKGMTVELKDRMRRKGKRIVPNCREVVINFNKKSVPEDITEHNDTHGIDWTEVPAEAPPYYTSQAALRLPDDSKPRYKLYWPFKYGAFNEEDYDNKDQILRDFTVIIEEAIKSQLGITQKKDWSQYECVYVVPDLYERNYVTTALDLLIREFGFARVCFIQESLSASFAAGYPTCCIVDVGAQKTSICCVDEGMCIDNSRINLRYGGADITETFMKMMLADSFPYGQINMNRRHDFLLAEELKQKCLTLSVHDVAVQQYECHLRRFKKSTEHYIFKAYDEVILAPMAFFRPELLDNDGKLEGRRSLISRSYDLYDGSPNDPLSTAQLQVLSTSAVTGSPPPAVNSADAQVKALNAERVAAKLAAALANPSPSTPQPGNANGNMSPDEPIKGEGDGANTPQLVRDASPSAAGEALKPDGTKPVDKEDPLDALCEEADVRDRTLPIAPLHAAIALSIEHAARGDERKMRDFLGGIIPVGGGTQIPGFKEFLEEELGDASTAGFGSAWSATSDRSAPGVPDAASLMGTLTRLRKEIMVAPPPREIDPQVLVWKGASVFGKLRGTNDSWISPMEYDRLGSRLLAYKCMWGW